MSLIFDADKFEVITVTEEGRTVRFRAFENIPYCERPADEKQQRLSVYVPEEYYAGRTINRYDINSAPVFFPNSVGGYMPGPQERPGEDMFRHETNASLFALIKGYVVVSPGVRGRGMKDRDGKNIGIAPAHIVDLKAAVRYLKANADRIPGNMEHIISNGTSAGGAISSLLGATGSHPDYEPYLKEIGAADADDSIFAASCYCPITNLDHADMAYEWEFNGLNDYHGVRMEEPGPGEHEPHFISVAGDMSTEQVKMSGELKSLFIDYLNGLGLKDKSGKKLTLDDNGNGSFKDYIADRIATSANDELDRVRAGRTDSCVGRKYVAVRNMTDNTRLEPADVKAVAIENEKVTGVDFDAFVEHRTRMKVTPAFDGIPVGTPENELFGTADVPARHFTGFSMAHDEAAANLADETQVRLMNPMNYVDDERALKARHYRIRHGAVDRDTSLAISEMLALKLAGAGVDTDIEHPWGIPHAGDYDLDGLFAWIDGICKE